MNLPIPGVGTEAGPNYAQDVNASLTLIDQHDHSLGSGVQITPAGLNINAALTLNNNNLTAVASVVFVNQSAIATSQAIYVKPGTLTNDLWYNNSAGVPVQLTSGNAVNATIANLPGESFDGTTFIWKQGDGSTTPANFDIGSITIRPNVAATTYGVVIQPPSAISSEYDFILPILPAAKSFMSIDQNGTVLAGPLFANGLTSANIEDGSITPNSLAPAAIVRQIVTTYAASGTFVVPSDFQGSHVSVEACGAGGGGGGGGFNGGAGTIASGGAGGGGALHKTVLIAVTAGETLTVTVGAGGAGNSGQVSAGPIKSGTDGGSTILLRSATTLFTWPGAPGGQGGNGVNAGISSVSTPYSTAGGSGGASAAGTAGQPAYASVGGTAGTNSTVKGGGGGGGAGSNLGAGTTNHGGNGGNGSTGTGGSASAGVGPGAGGGGGGGAGAVIGGSGFLGNDGYMRISLVALP